MKPSSITRVLSFILFSAFALQAHGEPAKADAFERWEAYSKTAVSITGDIAITPTEIEMGNGSHLPIEAVEGDVPNLYRFSGANKLKLLNDNTLCGNGIDNGYLILDASRANTLEILVFTGNSIPLAGGNADLQPGLCATFYYGKP